MNPDEARVLRLKTGLRIKLKDLGVPYPEGNTISIVADGTLLAHDAPLPGCNPHDRNRAGIRISDARKRADDSLVNALVTHAIASRRRALSASAQNEARRKGEEYPGWTVLVHPLAIALARHEGLPQEVVPARKREHGDGVKPSLRASTKISTVTTWDILSVDIRLRLDPGGSDILAELTTKSGRSGSILKLHMDMPQTIMTAMRRRPLHQVVTLPDMGNDPIQKELDGLEIAVVKPGRGLLNMDGTHRPAMDIVLMPTRWRPWGMAPEEILRLLELAPEIH